VKLPTLLATLAVVAAALGALVIVLIVAGLAPLPALKALGAGAFGDGHRIGVTLLRATPLLLTGLAVALAFRAGLWNIGAEGQLLVGALAAAWAGTSPALTALPGGALAVAALAVLAGAFWGFIPGTLRGLLDVPEVIATIVLNFVAVELLSYAVQGPLREAAGRYPQTDALAAGLELSPLGVVPAGLILGLAAAGFLHLGLHRSRLGLALRAAGLNPRAAEVAGMRPRLQAIWVLALSGGLAGLAGAAEVQGSMHRLYESYEPGYGYTAIAVALLARLEPLAVVPAALFFGALAAGAERMQTAAAVPAAVSVVVQAVVVLGSVLAGRREKREAT